MNKTILLCDTYKYSRKAGLRTAADVRHARAVESGIDLITIKDLLAHSRFKMVLRYQHQLGKHRFAAICKIEEMQTVKLNKKGELNSEKQKAAAF